MKTSTSISLIVVVIAAVGLIAAREAVAPRETKVAPPVATPTAGWETFTDAARGFELKYPAGFFDASQPPHVFAGSCEAAAFPGACPSINDLVVADEIAAGGDATAIRENLASPRFWNGAPEQLTLGGVPYCVYSTSDAGMSHTYASRYYVTVRDQLCVVTRLTTSQTTCSVYLPLEAGNVEQRANYEACQKKNEDQPGLLKQVEATFRFVR